jgi:large subunit GTPase 1
MPLGHGKNQGHGKNTGLGKQLVKSQKVQKRTTKTTNKTINPEGHLHSADLQDGYDWGRMNLQSVTEESSYNDFLNTAELARRDFDAAKWDIKLMDAQTRHVYIDTEAKKETVETIEDKTMKIPRRPDWTHMTAEELRLAENDAFLEWRRGLAELQERTDCVLTPYEKNLEFWRQLWRVIERSDVVVQIVDARNPELFRCTDLEMYVKEVSPLKQNLILINKADYLTEEQRKEWAGYLSGDHMNNTKLAFFSAIQEDDEDQEDDDDKENDDHEESSDEDDDEDNFTSSSYWSAPVNDVSEADFAAFNEEDVIKFTDPTEIFTSSRLMDYFRSLKRTETEILTVGFIGYPNVGKSSTINKILKSKKVRVSETPGKTKHFQTLVLADDLTLCDCPGLVMPSFASSKADMLLNGILPIDQLKDHVPPFNLLLTRIPTFVLESTYGLVLPKTPVILTSEQVLTAYAVLRGFMTPGGCPDKSRGARVLLKDYVSGKMLYCRAPTGLKQEGYHSYSHIEPRREWKNEQQKEEAARKLQMMKKTKTEEVDSKFFAMGNAGAHVGRLSKAGNRVGRLSEKNKKKQKIKRVFPELDPKHA